MTISEVGLRERKKQKTREALIRSALDQFADRGFDDVTVEEICARCEVSPRTFFRYFASKEDVLFAEVRSDETITLRTIDEQPQEMAPLDVMEAALCALAARYQVQRRDYLIRRHIHSTPSLATRVAENRKIWEDEFVDHLRATSRAAELSDFELRLTISLAVTAFRLAVDAWISSDGREMLPAFVSRAIEGLRQLK